MVGSFGVGIDQPARDDQLGRILDLHVEDHHLGLRHEDQKARWSDGVGRTKTVSMSFRSRQGGAAISPFAAGRDKADGPDAGAGKLAEGRPVSKLRSGL